MTPAMPLLALLLGLGAQALPAAALEPDLNLNLNLNLYQDAHGALTVVVGGDSVDPYFALRALLSASQAGLDIEAPAQAWIAWLLPRQQADGSFARYCRTPGADWTPCAKADADDALAALWAQLLYARAPCRAMAPAWRASAASSLALLERLRQRQRGTYQISADHPASLLMDNAEIVAALRAIAARQRCMGQVRAARRTGAAAERLASAIGRVFRPHGQTAYLVSTQTISGNSFYPHRVAQVYPVLFGLVGPAAARASMQAWLAEHGATWLDRSDDTYPWGLVALAADGVGLAVPALRWLERAAPLRHGRHWNILEEASFQALCLRYRAQALPCQARAADMVTP